MAKVAVLCWQDIPSSVEVKDGRSTSKLQLSQRFMELIDAVAMRKGLAGSDDYLMHWKKVAKPDRSGEAGDIAKAVAEEIESRFEAIREAALNHVE
jgi:hypothetical protein